MQNITRSTRNIVLNDVYLIRHDKGYLGHIHPQTNRSIVFAFRNLRHADEVTRKFNRTLCSVTEYTGNSYIVEEDLINPKTKLDTAHYMMYTECYGVLNAHIHLSMNNVNMHIIDTMIENDDGDIYLMSSTQPPTPLFVNDDMIKMHFDRLLKAS